MATKLHLPRRTILGLTGLLALAACSSSPMRARLDKNFVYNCTLELVDKGVKALEAEKVCVSSHQAELLEEDRRLESLRSPAAERNRQSSAQPNAPVAPAAPAPTPVGSQNANSPQAITIEAQSNVSPESDQVEKTQP